MADEDYRLIAAIVTLLIVAALAWLASDLPWPWKVLVWLYATKWTLNLILQPGRADAE